MVRVMMNGLIAVAVGSGALAGPLNAQSRGGQDPFMGVWKVNVERSVYVPGPRPSADAGAVYQFEPLEDGSIRFTLTGSNAAGGLNIQVSVFRIDGQQHPVYNVATITELMKSGKTTNVTRSYRRIDANTVEFTGYTDGVPTAPTIRQMQPDGNSYVQRPASGEGTVLLLERVR